MGNPAFAATPPAARAATAGLEAAARDSGKGAVAAGALRQAIAVGILIGQTAAQTLDLTWLQPVRGASRPLNGYQQVAASWLFTELSGSSAAGLHPKALNMADAAADGPCRPAPWTLLPSTSMPRTRLALTLLGRCLERPVDINDFRADAAHILFPDQLGGGIVNEGECRVSLATGHGQGFVQDGT